MKYIIIVVIILGQASVSFAQQGKRYVKKGNDLYLQQNYTAAESSYRRSAGVKTPMSTEATFNLGDALYKQKKFSEAAEQFQKIIVEAGSKNDPQHRAVTAKAYHNLGNALMSNKKLEEAIEAYKKSLLNNPKDEETRYNLAYAQELLKKQQQQNKDKKDQNKDKKDEDKKDKDKPKDKDDKNKKDQNKDQQNKDQQKNEKQDNGQEQDQQPGQLSKEDAQRMLDAMNNNEKQTQDKLKAKKFKGQKGRVSKDW